MSNADHALLAPSSAARRVQCPGSTMAERAPDALPEPETDDAPEGVAAHWAGAMGLEDLKRGGQGDLPPPGTVAPNGIPLTVDMLDGAQVWVDDVSKVLRESATDPKYLNVERAIRIPFIHAEHSWGTPDDTLWTTRKGGGFDLYIWDFKYGHRFVPAYENAQCIEYASGELSAHSNIADTDVWVHIRIVQPRCFSTPEIIREWVVNAGELRAHFNIHKSAAEEALGANPRFRPGEECRDCRARFNCQALRATGAAIMDHTTRVQPMGLSADALGWELGAATRALALLKSYVSGLEAQADHLLKSGQRVPGVIAQAGRGRTVWSVPAQQVIDMARAMGVDIAQPPEALTPLQAEKKGLNAAVVAGLSTHKPGAVTIKVDDGSLARRIGFGQS